MNNRITECSEGCGRSAESNGQCEICAGCWAKQDEWDEDFERRVMTVHRTGKDPGPSNETN